MNQYILVMNLVRITDFDKNKLLSFFKPLEFTIAVEAIIDGTSEGALWMDGPVKPSIGLLWDFADGVYLVSKEYSESLRQAIQDLFENDIIPETEKRTESPVFVLYAFPSQWNDNIYSLFSTGWTVSNETACFYERPLSLPDPKTSLDSLPAPFFGKPIDSKLFTSSHLKNLHKIIKEVESDWGSLEKYLSGGFGYCVIDEKANSLASWGVTGNIARSCAELGIETMEDYRRKGFATYITSQMLSTSSRLKLTPHWYCFKNNIASVKLAEKNGFHKIQDFMVYIIEKKE